MPKKSRATSFENIFVSEAHRVIYSEISYLKKRIHLVEGERKANYESNEETLKKNTARIKELRAKNHTLKERRKSMLESKDTYFKQIAKKLGGERKAYEFRDKTFSEAEDILECKIGTLTNKCNALNYTKTGQDKQMAVILEQEVNLKSAMHGKEPFEKESHAMKRQEEIKATETDTAAMQMKITEGDNIRCRYRNMITLLKSENYSLNIQVTEQHRKMDVDKSEMERIRQVLSDSMKAKKFAKTRLAEIEETTIKEYSEREQQLYDARMQLKQIRDQMEQIGSKLSFPKFHMIHRDSSITDGLYTGYKLATEKGETKTQTIIETVYNQLANMIGENDPALIVVRFQEQRIHAKELLVQEDIAKSAVRKAKLRKRFLVDKLSQLQYSGGLRREKLNAKSSKINQEMYITTTERDKLDKWLHDHCSAMEQMQSKLNEICQNNELKSPALESEIPTENVKALLKFLLKNLEKILGAQDGLPYSPVLLSPSVLGGGKERDAGGLGLSLLDISNTAEGSFFGLPSPAGSTTSFRLGGSISDVEMPISALEVGLGDKFPFELDGFIGAGARDRAPSIVIPDGSMLGGIKTSIVGIEEETANLGKRDGSAGLKVKTLGLRRGDSSEEEEAVSRNFVKRQSQILYEAKTRKGRFTPGGGGMAVNVRSRKY